MHEKVYVCKWKTNDDRFQNYFGKMESEISSNKDVQSTEKVKVLGWKYVTTSDKVIYSLNDLTESFKVFQTKQNILKFDNKVLRSAWVQTTYCCFFSIEF